MLRFILIIMLLCVSTPLWAGKAAPIEIYAAGKRYGSMEEYRNRDVAVQEVKNTPQQVEDIQEAAKVLGINVDPSKVKTIEVKAGVSPQTQDKLKLVALDDDVDGAIADFKQNWNNPQAQPLASSEQLEDKIREAIGDQKDPVLLISDHGKMRIMALTPKELPKPQ